MTAADDQPQPLFAVLQAGTRPLGAALTTKATPPLAAQWLPQATQPAVDDVAAERRATELAEVRATAIAEGRAQGLRETAVLRDTLKQLALELATARAARMTRAAEAIAACAIAAIEGWTANAPKQELFAPIISAWLERAGRTPATAKVHPTGVAELTEAIGDAPITVEADPAILPGDLKLRGEALDVTHTWAERLRELRDVIATAIEQQQGEPA